MDLLAQFCPHCGARTEKTIPKDDHRQRRVCLACQTIHYDNPKVVAGAVCLKGDEVLLCKRAIEPRYGYWTLPAGFLEHDEDVEHGVKREALEEACVELHIKSLLGVYSLPYISQVQLIYLADVVSDFSPGPESLDVRLYRFEDIPWNDLAFITVTWALKYAEKHRNKEILLPERRIKKTWMGED